MTNFIPQPLAAEKNPQKIFILVSIDCQSPKYLPENKFYALQGHLKNLCSPKKMWAEFAHTCLETEFKSLSGIG